MRSSVEGATVLITGGAGMVGSHIADRLLEGGAARVLALDNMFRGRTSNIESVLSTGRFELVVGDIRDRDIVDRLTSQVDFVFHEAAVKIHRCNEHPREALEILVDGSFNVIESASEHQVRKLIVASSGSVYGEPCYLPMDEAHPYKNDTLYGAGKLAMEAFLPAFSRTHGLSYCICRPFNVYGERMDASGAYTEVIVRWLTAIDSQGPIVIHGDGTQTYDFVHVDDIARMQVAALESSISGEVFNVGTGVGTSLNALAELLMKVAGKRVPLSYQRSDQTFVERKVADTTKAKELLGFEADIDLRTGLERLLEWWPTRREVAEVA